MAEATLRKPLTQRPLDFFYFVYFILHIFVTCVVDSAGLLPPSRRAWFQTALLQVQIEQNKDPLMANPPVWLRLYLLVELVVQLPIFIFGAIALYKNSRKVYIALLIYGVNASITTLACLGEIVWGYPNAPLTFDERASLFWIYLPTFLIPLAMTIDMVDRMVRWTIVDDGASEAKKKD
ncbi:transmembrane protein 6/97 [Limtongia smithiae]|uniref:transmembrane protein 6/97 n=1 Tax=Limtongia smithiae TaxID=1125753 RepID=UPI0034CD7202